MRTFRTIRPWAAQHRPVTSRPTDGSSAHRATPQINIVFAGLMLALLAAAGSQSIVAPALPRIAADLGGVEHYAWVATGALLASAVVVPVVGRLSDIYGRRRFFLAGLSVFGVGSALAGASPSFAWLIGARVVQGVGMGAILAMSQAIVADLVSPRERGRYQGLLGAVFGLASVGGPLAGGWLTDHASWRWCFYVNLPLLLVALTFVAVFLRLPERRTAARIDVGGFVSLSLGLTCLLLAISWGGTEYPWLSAPIVGLGVGAASALGWFVRHELRVVDPVVPLHLWRNTIVSWANLAALLLGMTMFGAVYFIPVFAQGVLGESATNSGLILIPLTLAMVTVSALVGALISRTGRYKGFVLAGIVVVGAAYGVLATLDADSSTAELTLGMVMLGMGLGAALQTFTLIVQNAVTQREVGIATALAQFSRSLGATLGIAVFGAIFSSRLASEVAQRLPQQRTGALSDAGSAALDPAAIGRLPQSAQQAVHDAIASALHPLFLLGLPLAALALLAAARIHAIPLRRSLADDEPTDGASGSLRSGLNDHLGPVCPRPATSAGTR